MPNSWISFRRKLDYILAVLSDSVLRLPMLPMAFFKAGYLIKSPVKLLHGLKNSLLFFKPIFRKCFNDVKEYLSHSLSLRIFATIIDDERPARTCGLVVSNNMRKVLKRTFDRVRGISRARQEPPRIVVREPAPTVTPVFEFLRVRNTYT
jgi:hypothetical protein